MNRRELERAVITAARSWHTSIQADRAEGFHGGLSDAVTALDAFEAEQAEAGITEIEWRELAAGDRLKSIKNGKFYHVESVLAVGRGKRRIRLTGVPDAIERPTEKEPKAIVKRGPDGKAVSMFVNVFSSGSA